VGWIAKQSRPAWRKFYAKGGRVLVSINMAMSMDGKIATKARGPVKLGTALDTRRMAEIRALHDAVINGASTFRAYPFPLHVTGDDLQRERALRGQKKQPISAIVSSDLRIPRGTPWEKSRETERWLFCGKNAPAKAIDSFEKSGVTVIRSRAQRPSPREIISAFGKAGVTKLLLEGGGEFNASFLELGLVSRVHLTLTPLVIGGSESPTWCEGKGFLKGKFPRFRLEECRKEGEELYLTYEKA
jgi:riboflavin-specific deaminase-like protein